MTDMHVHQALKCPMCNKILFEGFWVARVLSVVIHCRCKRILEITETYHVRVKEERPQPTSP
jgi:phage FluMu protein Com